MKTFLPAFADASAGDTVAMDGDGDAPPLMASLVFNGMLFILLAASHVRPELVKSIDRPYHKLAEGLVVAMIESGEKQMRQKHTTGKYTEPSDSVFERHVDGNDGLPRRWRFHKFEKLCATIAKVPMGENIYKSIYIYIYV